MSNRSILAKYGTTVDIFVDRNCYPRNDCNLIENLVSCDKQALSKVSSVPEGELRLKDTDGSEVSLKIDGGTSKLSNESLSILVLRCSDGKVKANAYYGKDSDLDFKNSSDSFSLRDTKGYVDTIKEFISSLVCVKGEGILRVVIVDRTDVFQMILSDSFFNDMYILLSD